MAHFTPNIVTPLLEVAPEILADVKYRLQEVEKRKEHKTHTLLNACVCEKIDLDKLYDFLTRTVEVLKEFDACALSSAIEHQLQRDVQEEILEARNQEKKNLVAGVQNLTAVNLQLRTMNMRLMEESQRKDDEMASLTTTQAQSAKQLKHLQLQVQQVTAEAEFDKLQQEKQQQVWENEKLGLLQEVERIDRLQNTVDSLRNTVDCLNHKRTVSQQHSEKLQKELTHLKLENERLQAEVHMNINLLAEVEASAVQQEELLQQHLQQVLYYESAAAEKDTKFMLYKTQAAQEHAALEQQKTNLEQKLKQQQEQQQLLQQQHEQQRLLHEQQQQAKQTFCCERQRGLPPVVCTAISKCGNIHVNLEHECKNETDNKKNGGSDITTGRTIEMNDDSMVLRLQSKQHDDIVSQMNQEGLIRYMFINKELEHKIQCLQHELWESNYVSTTVTNSISTTASETTDCKCEALSHHSNSATPQKTIDAAEPQSDCMSEVELESKMFVTSPDNSFACVNGGKHPRHVRHWHSSQTDNNYSDMPSPPSAGKGCEGTPASSSVPIINCEHSHRPEHVVFGSNEMLPKTKVLQWKKHVNRLVRNLQETK